MNKLPERDLLEQYHREHLALLQQINARLASLEQQCARANGATVAEQQPPPLPPPQQQLQQQQQHIASAAAVPSQVDAASTTATTAGDVPAAAPSGTSAESELQQLLSRYAQGAARRDKKRLRRSWSNEPPRVLDYVTPAPSGPLSEWAFKVFGIVFMVSTELQLQVGPA